MACVLLSGCWDQDYLKDARLVYGSALDLTDEGKIHSTMAVREVSGGGAQVNPVDEFYSAEGETVVQLRDKLDRQMSGKYRPYKNRILLLGEDLVKRDLFAIMDFLYRDPKAALNASLAVTEGKSSDYILMGKVGKTLIAEYLKELIDSEQEKTIIPEENIQTILKEMYDPACDFGLPYIRKKDQGIEVGGIALFHGQRMTGLITVDEQVLLTLLLLMDGYQGKVAQITEKVGSEGEMPIEQFIVIDVAKAKRETIIQPDPVRKIKVQIPVKLSVSVAEYPHNQLDEEQVVMRLNGILSKKLTERAKQVIQKLQAANCDYFGIGLDVRAFHPDLWKKVSWEKDFPQIKIEPQVQVEIMGHGVIN